MENMSGFSAAASDDDMGLPPGFRFHPTDEELITFYLSPKVADAEFSPIAIGEVDLKLVEPWDLPWIAKMGEKEWYFFCVRDRKYPTGMRSNRATVAGYWKATGKDKEIFKEKILVGMKKTLVFYKGRAPRGEKTNWVMHEYRLESHNSIPRNAKNEWVVCRVFKKTSGGKKIHISGLIRGENSRASKMPPLMEASSHVPCFSNSVEDQKPENIPSPLSKNSSDFSTPTSFLCNPSMPPYLEDIQYSDHSIMKLLIGTKSESEVGPLRPYEDQESLMTSAAGPVDLDCLWNY